jgi:peptide/nickel transport system ATP-binding protein
MTEPILEIRGLTRRFPVKRAEHRPWRRAHASWLHAVDGVEFAIAPGETVGLVGESGCGKSTLVRLVTRLIDPSSGNIGFAGKEIGAIPARRFARTPQRASIQMVFQDAGESLNPRFTAARAIADPLLRLSRVAPCSLHACARPPVWPVFRTSCWVASHISSPAARRRESASPARSRSSRS